MSKYPEGYPFAPYFKKVVSLLPFQLFADYVDSAIAWISEQGSMQPIALPSTQADGSMQNLSHTLKITPRIVQVILTKPPIVVDGITSRATDYKVEYGTHTDAYVQVKISFPSDAASPEFVTLIFP